jgi:hypothetical protein
MRLTVHHRLERLADELAHLPRTRRRGDPGIGRDTGVGGRDALAIGQVVVAIDGVQEEHAGLGVVIRGLHDLVPQLTRGQLAIDPDGRAVGQCARVGAGFLVARAGFGTVHQFDLGVGDHRFHEGVGHAHADVEVLQVALVLGVDELLDVRMVAAQHTHLRTAAGAGALHRLAAAVEDAHVAHRPAGAALGAAHPGAPWADAAEVIAHAAAAAHGLGGLGQRGVDARVAVVDAGNAVAHRLHEAVDQGGRQGGAGGRLDAPGGHEATFQRLQEAPFPPGALVGGFDLGQRAGHAAVHVGHAAFVALGVLLGQHLGTDRLGRQLGGWRCGGRSWRAQILIAHRGGPRGRLKKVVKVRPAVSP